MVLHDGLYYLNSLEWAVSSAETAVVAAKNAANAAFDFWIDKSKEAAEEPGDSGKLLKETKKLKGWLWGLFGFET